MTKKLLWALALGIMGFIATILTGCRRQVLELQVKNHLVR